MIALVDQVKSIAATTAAKDFTGCGVNGLFVAHVGIFDAGTFSDTGINDWQLHSTRTGGSGGSLRTYYCVHPIVTADQQFSYSGVFYSIVVKAFSGVHDFEDASAGADAPATQPGSATATFDGSLYVTGFGGGDIVTATVDSPFAGTEFSNDYSAGVNYSCASAHYIQPSNATLNPTWSKASGTGACTMLLFKPHPDDGLSDLYLSDNPVARLQ